MAAGKTVIVAVGTAILMLLGSGLLAGGEAGDYGYAPEIDSIRRNASVTIGGEIRTDYTYRAMNTGGVHPAPEFRLADLTVKNANLRIRADVHPNLRAIFKLNLSSDAEVFPDRDELLEEALLVMNAVGGTGWGFFTGRGRAPYGQDVTLGMLQSYNHSANRVDSPEGRIFIIDPPADDVADPAGCYSGAVLPPMRPGQFERTFMAGASYEWNNRWRVEVAAFQPSDYEYEPRLRHNLQSGDRNGSDIGMAGRVWWSPFEELVLEASGMLAHSSVMGRGATRIDLRPGAEARSCAKAVSVGFDWRRGPWRVFGEYQHSWDWNFSKGYDTDTWQAGAGRDIGDRWRVGGMVEGLQIRDPSGKKTMDNYYKLALSIRHDFASGLFILGEYGHEWFRRNQGGEITDKRQGDFIGMRLGFSF